MPDSMTTSQRAKLGSRLLAIIYDSLIVFFIIVITIVVLQMLIGQGKEIPPHSLINHVLSSLWVILSFLYFGYFWTKRGQTPGMKVWKIKAISVNPPGNDPTISWTQALLRYVFALFGIGLLWMAFNKQHLALQDRISNTLLIKV